ncbi:MAG: dihydroorotate dehydrogenase electron transfer subunit [Gemmatimonadota bacterium]|nr:dihydroorotate dehydrogenase electron transfer subunit [Gemmatimonadota bacterium]
MSTPCRLPARVLSNQRAGADTYWLEIDAPPIAQAAVPGQFVMIGFGLGRLDAPFLPRPFSVGWRGDDGRIGLLVRRFGTGTHRLAALRPGDEVLLLGPLGRGFRWEQDSPLICIAGGVGLAPFLFMAPEAIRHGATVEILYGERTGDRVFDPQLVEKLTGIQPRLYTEDGSRGQIGRVIDGIERGRRIQLFGCGPTPMLRALERLAREEDLPLQVSVEEHMGCGIGTCQGCVVRSVAGEWIKSCTEGPVFRREELSWRD